MSYINSLTLSSMNLSFSLIWRNPFWLAVTELRTSFSKKFYSIFLANSTTDLVPNVCPSFLLRWTLNYFMADGETYSHSPFGPFCRRMSALIPKALLIIAPITSLTNTLTNFPYAFILSKNYKFKKYGTINQTI